MKLRYLGTAAAEGIPALFCACERCKRARELGGKNIRTRSQALLDDTLLIDYPPDSFAHMRDYGIDLSEIHDCVITHAHEDHLYPLDFEYLQWGFSHPIEGGRGFTVYGSEDVMAEMAKRPEKTREYLHGQYLAPYTPTDVNGYTVTALKAYHGTEHPYIYQISRDGKNLLYAHDTDIFPEETWDYLIARGEKFGLVSLDCTAGSTVIRYHGHMCLSRNIEVRDRMAANGLCDEKTKFVLNHFSHNGANACYDDMVPIAAAEGFLVSCDGMEIEF